MSTKQAARGRGKTREDDENATDQTVRLLPAPFYYHSITLIPSTNPLLSAHAGCTLRLRNRNLSSTIPLPPPRRSPQPRAGQAKVLWQRSRTTSTAAATTATATDAATATTAGTKGRRRRGWRTKGYAEVEARVESGY